MNETKRDHVDGWGTSKAKYGGPHWNSIKVDEPIGAMLKDTNSQNPCPGGLHCENFQTKCGKCKNMDYYEPAKMV